MTNDSTTSAEGLWEEKIFAADSIWEQIKQALAQTNTSLNSTPRRPDVRLIVNNISGQPVSFQNPGQHSDKPETVPAEGTSTSAMVMLQGDNLTDQHLAAFELYNRFNLGTQGLTPAFAAFLQTPEARELVKEAYGPAPFEAQSKKLVTVEWKPRNRPATSVSPVFAEASSFGARAATLEKAIIATTKIYVHGTNTIPELMDNKGIVIAITPGDQGAADKTRPIAPDIAEQFYGEDFDKIPVAVINTEGQVEQIDLRNGSTILLSPDGGPARLVQQDKAEPAAKVASISRIPGQYALTLAC